MYRERLEKKHLISKHLDTFFDSAVLRQKTLDVTMYVIEI